MNLALAARATGSKLRAGDMMTFIDNELAVMPHRFPDRPSAKAALDDGDVNCAGRFSAPTADPADRAGRQAKKRREALDPLILQLPAMHEHERVDAAFGDEPRADHGFPEGRGRGQHTRIVGQHRFRGELLVGPELSVEFRGDWPAGKAFIANGGRHVQLGQKLYDLIQAAAAGRCGGDNPSAQLTIRGFS